MSSIRVFRIGSKRLTSVLSSASRPVSCVAPHVLNRSVSTSSVTQQRHQRTQLTYPLRALHLSRTVFVDSVIVCPAFGAESVKQGDMIWAKAVGDAVTVDEELGALETDKTNVPVRSDVAGVIAELLVEDGTAVEPGTPLVRITIGGEGAAPAPPKPAEKPVAAVAPTPAAPAKPATPPPAAAPAPPKLMESRPTTPLPPIVKRSPAPATPKTSGGNDPTKLIVGSRTEHRVRMNRMRQRIADRLKEAQNTCAMLTTFNEVDMGNIMEFREDHKNAFEKKHGVKLGFMSAFVAASAFALKHQPVVNAVIEGTDIVYRDFVDISVAVATPKGLVVPVLRNCHDMNYADIEKAINALGVKARDNALAIEDMEGGTFTISNGGVFGSLYGTPIINPPQSAILGMHAIKKRPVEYKGQIALRPMMYVALTYDHRLVDGREAVTFLKKIKEAVEDPRIMFLEV